jgi:hypothetical protein
MQELTSSDRSRRPLVSARDLIRLQPRLSSEEGQATTEFALILFPLLILVTGIIWVGIGLNYWLDMQRVANQGARWAAVNNWPPDCPVGAQSCASPDTLQESLRRMAIAGGLERSVVVSVCYPSGTDDPGEPVRVVLSTPFELVPILGIGTIQLRADATMRLEQDPTLITGAVSPCP